ncbi:12887_t:CDS:2, partial [Entrophospora sp. SA101]
SFHDRGFKNEINKLIQQTRNAYEREATSQEGEGMHRDLILRWIELQALLLSPIGLNIYGDGFIVNASFPSPSEPGSKADNFDPNKPKSLKLFVATKFPEWQGLVVEAIKQNYDEESNSFDDGRIRANLGEKGILKNKKTCHLYKILKRELKKLAKKHLIGHYYLMNMTRLL